MRAGVKMVAAKERRRMLLDKLRLAAKKPDGDETAHIDADDALLEYIDDPVIRRAFEKVPRWYN